MRLQRALLIFFSLLLLPLSSCSDRAARPELRSVLLISVDTLRRDHVGVYGYSQDLTPTIDLLAHGGVRFDQAICQAPWTTPSTASFLCSLYPSVMRLGSFDAPGRIGNAVTTLAEALGELGLRTHAVTSGGCVKGEIGFAQGFEGYEDRPIRMDETVRNALSWLDTLDRDEPFFLFVHTYDVHNYDPGEPFRSDRVGPYVGSLPRGGELAPFLQSFDQRAEVARLTVADWRHVVELYDAALAEVDSRLAVLLEGLERQGRLDETLIVLLSDHGEEFGEHGSSGHGFTLFDENLRVPLILSHPSLPQDLRVDPQVSLLDVAPTIVDLLGGQVPPEWQGTSLAPVIHGAAPRAVAFTENSHVPRKSLRTADHKLVVSMAKPYRELFDLAADPHERDNRFWSGALPALPEMRELLARWIERNVRDERFIPRGDVGMSDELRRELEALGYLGGSGSKFAADTEYWLTLLRTDQGREQDARSAKPGH